MLVHILITSYLDADDSVKIGGLEHYTDTLATMLGNNGFEVIVYQYSEQLRTLKRGCYQVELVPAHSSKALLKYIDNHIHNYENDILIFATDYLVCKNKFKHSIAIQHGISWDLAGKRRKMLPIINYFFPILSAFRTIRKLLRYRYCSNIICVDYNFINWYRTQVAFIGQKIFPIPNYATVPLELKTRESCKVSVIFARRLVPYRGTKLFTEAIINVKKRHPELLVTIAGDGPEEQWMKERLKEISGISFTSFLATNSIDVHSQYDIAVVPTIISEGTSFSLLEAMAAGCAVIATNVGGITNILLDEYNGLLINSDQRELEQSLIRLIEDKKLRDALSQKGYDTVKEAFSFEKWSSSWIRTINTINDNNIAPHNCSKSE